MNWDIRIKYCDALSKSEYCDLVILANILKGENVKMTVECYEIINECIEKNMRVDEYLVGYDQDSKDYMQGLISLLKDKFIICEETEVEEQKSKISQVIMLVTNRCNLKCTHCSVDANGGCNENDLSTEKWKSIIDKLVGLNLIEVTISGGEPLVRKDIFEIAKYVKEKLKVKLQLMTNGTLISEDNIDELVNVFDSFSVSLDGVDEDSCAPVRGKGTFGRAMNGIELLKSRGVTKLSISFTKVKQNEDKVDAFNELAKRLGAFPMVRQFEVKGRAKEHLNLLPSSHKYYFDPVLSCERPKGGHFYPDKMPECVGCGAIYGKLSISADGKIYPCQVLNDQEFELGNALELASIKDYVLSGKIYKSKGYAAFEKYHPARSEKCKDCQVKLFCTSCLYQTYLLMNRDDMCEICEKKRKGLMAVWN